MPVCHHRLVLCGFGLCGLLAGADDLTKTVPPPQDGNARLVVGDEASPVGQRIAAGWEAINIAFWSRAITLFEGVAIDAAADDEAKATALYALGHCWQYRSLGSDLTKAMALYRRVDREHPTSRILPYALMELARIADVPLLESQREPAKARALYERILENHADHHLANEAALWLAMLRIDAAPDDQAVQEEAFALIRDRLKKRPTAAIASVMHQFIARTYARRARKTGKAEYWRAAVAALGEVERVGLPTERTRAQNALQAARIADHQLHDAALAIPWYRILIDEIPDDAWSFPAKLAVQRLQENQP